MPELSIPSQRPIGKEPESNPMLKFPPVKPSMWRKRWRRNKSRRNNDEDLERFSVSIADQLISYASSQNTLLLLIRQSVTVPIIGACHALAYTISLREIFALSGA